MKKKYALITAAYNEEKYIERTIQGVTEQEHLPEKWVIISDGSTDGTDKIIQEYSKKFSFIHYVRNTKKKGRTFFAKIFALREAYKELTGHRFDFIGNLDADIVMKPDYYKLLLEKMQADPELGVVSGIFMEIINGKEERYIPPERHTPGAIQFFRRQCWEKIGGYPLLNGGEDAGAEILLRMEGWKSRSYRDIEVLHLKPMGSGNAANILKARFKLGRVDYHLGMNFLYALAKLIKRLFQKPYILGGFALFFGYLSNCFKRPERTLPSEAIRFVKKEQLGVLFPFLRKKS